jgi:eukaryotic-like serine/threonine-protein kinase
MDAHGPTLIGSFVLPAGTLLTPVSELPDHVRRDIGADEGDVALVRSNSRAYSKLIDPQAAALVAEFRKPSTIAAAVARFSRGKEEQPERLLEDALPMLQSLIISGLLVSDESDSAKPIRQLLEPGQSVQSWQIVRCLQALEDTELYTAHGTQGEIAALKLWRSSDASALHALEREAAVLSLLNGGVAPRLLDRGVVDEKPYLVTEWFMGRDAHTVCTELRQTGNSSSQRLLSATGAILDAYSTLHEHGVVHGDVHARNVLIDAHGRVKLVDFGLAHLVRNEEPLSVPHRAGVSFFFEPEFALAVIAGGWPPAATFQGEQYSIAALLYFLLTGQHYLDFIVEKNAMLRQIAEEPPVPLVKRGIEQPGIEDLLHRALSKRPADRFESLAEFARAWAECIAGVPDFTSRSANNALLAVHRDVVNALRFDGTLFRGGSLPVPSTSITYGSAGIACALNSMARAHDDPTLLAAADCWSARAEREIRDPGAFYSDAMEITAKNVAVSSLYHGAGGVHATAALIAHARNDTTSRRKSLDAYAQVCRQRDDILDLVLGRTGALLGCALLLETSNDKTLREAGQNLATSLWHALGGYAPIAECRDLTALGMAHGWAGLLYATLCWSAVAGEAVSEALARRLNELAALAQRIGRGVQWKRDLAHPLDGPSAWAWCNGSAGHVFLWTRAYRSTGITRYLELAEGAAYNVWQEPAPHASLCCGTAGQAYALLNYYRCSGDSVWVSRARDIVASGNRLTTHPFSLFKGDTGLAVLYADLEHPDDARMPMFECDA